MPDASAVMQLLLKTQTDFNDLEDDDPQVGRPDCGFMLLAKCIISLAAFFFFLSF